MLKFWLFLYLVVVLLALWPLKSIFFVLDCRSLQVVVVARIAVAINMLSWCIVFHYFPLLLLLLLGLLVVTCYHSLNRYAALLVILMCFVAIHPQWYLYFLVLRVSQVQPVVIVKQFRCYLGVHLSITYMHVLLLIKFNLLFCFLSTFCCCTIAIWP